MFPVKNDLLVQSLLKYLFSLIHDSSAASSAACKTEQYEQKLNRNIIFHWKHQIKPSPRN